MALPPACPGYHASRIAGTCCCAQLTATALPFSSTSTVGFPKATTRSSRCCCGAEVLAAQTPLAALREQNAGRHDVERGKAVGELRSARVQHACARAHRLADAPQRCDGIGGP